MNDEKEKLLRFKIKRGNKLEDWFTLKSGDIIQIINPNLTGYNQEEMYIVYYDNSNEFIEKDVYYNEVIICSYEHFAEDVERNGLVVTPLRKNLPPFCYVLLNDRGQIAKLTKGVSGYQILEEINCADLNLARQVINDLNRKYDVSAVQASAMYIGAMYGWDKEGANPSFYVNTSIEIHLSQLPGGKIERRKAIWKKGL